MKDQKRLEGDNPPSCLNNQMLLFKVYYPYDVMIKRVQIKRFIYKDTCF